MPTTEHLRSRLMKKLKELFQLDQPDLDFGFYRIMHAKAQQVSEFLDKDLLRIVEDAFGHVGDTHKAELQAAYEKAVQTAKDFGAPNPEETEPVKKARAALDAASETASSEADIYDHLYRFFERYYDNGDFISRRYFTRETPGKAAPFAVPYNGEEVKLHWANADQYYIKTAEYFTNFTFDLRQAKDVMENRGSLGLGGDEGPLKVHFRIAEAAEGEHGNVKESEATKRYFIIHSEKQVEVTEQNELVVNFEYRPDPEKSGQDNTWRDKRNAEAIEKVLARLEEMVKTNKSLNDYLRLLKVPAPTDSDKKRPLLAKYINQYTARNTMDYFIHKDLDGFLRRELDFYIKNEVMRLDDIENAEVPAVESYLAKLKVLRKIAGKLIDFLAQLEEFQKKLWLKKKFVVETNYCITLDRIPEELYAEIAANATQHDEWIEYFKIDKIEPNTTGNPGYAKPLNVAFLTANNKLVLDTRFFSDEFKARLIASIENIDESLDGVCIAGDNADALRLIRERHLASIECVCIDPPYNTGSDGFCYKDGYKSSTWLTQQSQTLPLARSLMTLDGSLFAFNDENEERHFALVLEALFGIENFVETIIWNKRIPKNDKGIGNIHDYVFLLANDLAHRRSQKKSFTMRKDELDDIYELIQRCKRSELSLQDAQEELKKFYRKQGYDRGITLYCELDPTYRPWGKINMSWPNAKTEGPRYEIISPVTNQPVPIPDNGWRWKEDTFRAAESNGPAYTLPDGSMMKGRIWYSTKDTVQPSSITYLDEVESFLLRSILSVKSDGSVSLDLLGLGGLFDYPKSVLLVERLIHSIGDNAAYILDHFAGSGTSGHAIINLNREDGGRRKYLLVEMGGYFNTVLIPRLKKVIYSSDWKDGYPQNRNTAISHTFKILRLENYEDTLNNLHFAESLSRNKAIEANSALRKEYILKYLMDVETRGSQSLLNIDSFANPTAYKITVKKPGSDEYAVSNVDLIETFNYLIGLRVNHIATPQTFVAAFKRNTDPELPHDQHTKLVVDGKIKQDVDGPWWFRKVEGWVPKDPAIPNNGQREKVLIVWRKLTGDLEKDNLMLDEWFEKNRISTRDFEFDTIYVNGSNNLPNLLKEGDNWKVRLIEEEFMKRMWSGEGM